MRIASWHVFVDILRTSFFMCCSASGTQMPPASLPSAHPRYPPSLSTRVDCWWCPKGCHPSALSVPYTVDWRDAVQGQAEELMTSVFDSVQRQKQARPMQPSRAALGISGQLQHLNMGECFASWNLTQSTRQSTRRAGSPPLSLALQLAAAAVSPPLLASWRQLMANVTSVKAGLDHAVRRNWSRSEALRLNTPNTPGLASSVPPTAAMLANFVWHCMQRLISRRPMFPSLPLSCSA